MKIGVDLSVLQTPNRMRGIGATLINFLNHLPEDYTSEHSFVFFLNDGAEQSEVLELVNLNKTSYEVRYLSPRYAVSLPLPGRTRIVNQLFNKLLGLKQFYTGDSRFATNSIADLDSFIQFDTSLGLPKKKGLKTVRILYDLIPYVMVTEYMWDYRSARMHGDSRYRSLRKSLSRSLFKFKTKRSLKNADILVSISEQTKHDYEKHMKTRQTIHVCHLGADFYTKSKSESFNTKKFQRYTETVWGDLPLEKVGLSDKPFLLYVGGADKRRKLVDLVGAFNNLRARGNDLRLVMTGDTLFGAESIPTKEVSKYLGQSSYLQDIVFLGFTTEEEKALLYENALAFVFPTVYEGFGLPILEAMQYGCPVITYKNSSIPEIGGEAAIYVDGLEGILKSTEKLINEPSQRNKVVKDGRSQAQIFNWKSTSKNLLHIISTD